MIHGTVSADGVPTITLSIASQDWTATIDTGFNGDLELPEALRNSLNARYVGQVTSALAGGQMIEEDVYLIDFPFDGRVIQAEATFVAENITENGSATINGITMKASSEVCGVITSITLASGQVIAYRL